MSDEDDLKLIVETMRRLFDPSDRLTPNEFSFVETYANSLESKAHGELAMLLAVANHNSLLMRGVLAYLVAHYGRLIAGLFEGQAKYLNYVESYAEMTEIVKAELIERIATASENGRRSANKRHEGPGGSREMRALMREAWWSGRYKNKSECAAAESGRLGISLETARKSLRNVPRSDPTR